MFMLGISAAFSNVVAFFSTKIGQIILVCLLGVGLFIAGDVHRYRADKVKFDRQTARMIAEAEEARAARDLEAKIAADKDASERMAEVAKLKIQLEGKLNAYEKELATRADRMCKLKRADIRRLRKL